eukprot:TRINITY_DN4807_c0_g2_i2.p1 TRINITY_DN4807_c0_g2~~TRINITY_DN4807_c0_g2_i2.p1  ORF type:complete len:128 (-),score=42.75 TRINITY_DN4807_c0_g2_i2:63-446(-)
MAGATQAAPAELQKGLLIAIIGDADTVTGFLLAGIGQRGAKGNNNFFVVDGETTRIEMVEEAFNRFTSREDIGIIMINQSIANEIRHLINRHSKAIPTIVEIPSKDNPYDPTKDKVMGRVRQLLGKD